jgi:glycerol uptake facilitator-like aquaporin
VLVGTLLLVYITMWISMSPQVIPSPPDPQLGNFDNAAFIGPLVGGVANFVLLTIFTFIFGAVSGAHLNPTITIATFCARLTSLPRMVLYVAFQTIGGALAGLLVRASYGTRHFKVGGCWLYTDVVPAADAFVIELVSCILLLFFAFGVGLDPRQRQLIGLSLAPFLVGLTVGILSFGTAFTRYGYGGASLNPARCFGAFVGSSFPGWHWLHW